MQLQTSIHIQPPFAYKAPKISVYLQGTLVPWLQSVFAAGNPTPMALQLRV